MNNAGFKSLIVFALLAIFAFIAGSLASENTTSALAPMAILLGLFFLLYLGKNCWILVFIVPPVLSTINLSILRNFPVAFLVCGIVLVYMLLLNMMGYFKLKWNGVAVIDIMTAVLCVYFLSTWVRHPVTIQALTSITDFGADTMVGGKEYVWCIGAIICYISLSLVPIKLPTLLKTMKWAFWLSFIFACIMCAKGIVTGNVNLGEEVATTRFGAFADVSSKLLQLMIFKYSVIGIAVSPWKLCIVVSGFLGIALSGFRSYALNYALLFVIGSFIYRQLIIFFVITLASWGIIVYMSHEGAFEDIPFGIKRVLSAVPGVEFENEKAAKEAEGSSEWRYKMWRWAMDSSKGYIHDYVWGDGFGLSVREEQLRRISFGLGLKSRVASETYAERGEWHNGAISIVQQTGFVGLALVCILFISYSVLVLYVCMRLVRICDKEYIYIALLSIVPNIILIFYLPNDYIAVFSSFYAFALAKSVYRCMQDEGFIVQADAVKLYLPMLYRDNSNL